VIRQRSVLKSLGCPQGWSRALAPIRSKFSFQATLTATSKIYPISSYCKKVRETSGVWVEVEKYIWDISRTLPSHGICPECYEREKELLTI